MNLSKKKITLYSILLLLVFLALYYRLFLVPTMKEIQLTLRDITILQDSLTAAENKESCIKNIISDRDRSREDLRGKQAKLSEQLDSHDLILILYKAHANKLIKHSLIFLEPVQRDDFCIIPVRFSFSADNKSLSEFLSGLEELGYQLTISYMQISADNIEDNNQYRMDENTKVRYNLEVEMTLNFYVKGYGE